MNKLYNMLIAIERQVPVEIHAPISGRQKEDLKKKFPDIPDALMELFSISNGIEVNVPGTVFYSVEDLMKNMKMRVVSQKEGWYPLGRMSFGDELFINQSGRVIQVDHETGEIFLEWKSPEEFLEDETSGYGG